MYCNLHCIHLGYVDDIRKLLFSVSKCDMAETRKKYEGKAPDPLNSQYPGRRAREEAIQHQDERRQKTPVLFPPGEYINIYIYIYIHIYICIYICR